jgi:phage-related protein
MHKNGTRSNRLGEYVPKNRIDIYNDSVILTRRLEIVVTTQARRELNEAPKDLLPDIFALFEDLARGRKLSMPLSRPLPSIGRGLHELRLSGRSGEFRVFYLVKVGDAIYVIHAATKKRQTMNRQTKDLLRTRMRNLEL